MIASAKKFPPAQGGPAWDIARLYPDQGAWSEDDYLLLDTNHLVEFTDGYVEVLPMPTTSHQLAVQYLSRELEAFVGARKLGTVLFAPLRVKIRPGRFREPDVVFMLEQHAGRIGEEFWEGADLVMEVVSDDPEGRKRDLEKKPKEYAAAGIGEYWIADPQEKRVVVMKLVGKKYVVRGKYEVGERAESALIKGFGVEVGKVFR
jgi:Uma2 family endonuclease